MATCPGCGRAFYGAVPELHQPSSIIGSTADPCTGTPRPRSVAAPEPRKTGRGPTTKPQPTGVDTRTPSGRRILSPDVRAKFVEEAKARHEAGESYKDIAKVFDVSNTTVANWVRENGKS